MVRPACGDWGMCVCAERVAAAGVGVGRWGCDRAEGEALMRVGIPLELNKKKCVFVCSGYCSLSENVLCQTLPTTFLDLICLDPPCPGRPGLFSFGVHLLPKCFILPVYCIFQFVLSPPHDCL